MVDLVELDKKYSQKNFEIVAFPCNMFSYQEPGDSEDTKLYARGKYKAEFDIYAKVEVNGKNAHPIFKYLQNHKNGKGTLTNQLKTSWTKFLINKEGDLVERFSIGTTPMSEGFLKKIDALL